MKTFKSESLSKLVGHIELFRENCTFIHLFISDIYIAPLQETYSEALCTLRVKASTTNNLTVIRANCYTKVINSSNCKKLVARLFNGNHLLMAFTYTMSEKEQKCLKQQNRPLYWTTRAT